MKILGCGAAFLILSFIFDTIVWVLVKLNVPWWGYLILGVVSLFVWLLWAASKDGK